MPYSELDKLQHEVEKLRLEIALLKRPFIRQPASWITLVTLIVSVSVNISQCSDLKMTEKEASIKLQQASLDTRLLKMEEDSLKRKVYSLKGEEESIGEQLKINQDRLTLLKDSVTKFQTDLLANRLTEEEKEKKLDNILTAINRASSVNQSTTNNISATGMSSKKSNDLETAKQKEREGFEYILRGDYENAANAFQSAENAYNGYHWVYELSRLMRLYAKESPEDQVKKREVLEIVMKKHLKGAPADIVERIKTERNKPL
jgi:Na+/phosphate symporter